MSIRMKACKRCGEMDFFVDQLCAACETEMHELFVTVKHYVEDHPGVDLAEIVEETGVDEKAVIFMIDNEWLYQSRGETDARRRCSSCGIPIAEGKMCARCTAQAQGRLRSVMQGMKEPAGQKPGKQPPSAGAGKRAGDDYSGMYVRNRKDT